MIFYANVLNSFFIKLFEFLFEAKNDISILLLISSIFLRPA